jgi:CRP-like cAMP-binding protein
MGTGLYHCDAVTVERATVLRFPAQPFRAALAADESFRDAWLARLAHELLKSRAQCERLGLKSAAQRIVHYIELEGTDGTITLSETRMAWASELGLTHEALYRTLRRLRAEGTLDIHGDRITLKQRQGGG